jgi:hypothetical protein
MLKCIINEKWNGQNWQLFKNPEFSSYRIESSEFDIGRCCYWGCCWCWCFCDRGLRRTNSLVKLGFLPELGRVQVPQVKVLYLYLKKCTWYLYFYLVMCTWYLYVYLMKSTWYLYLYSVTDTWYLYLRYK